jgi:hypothetical protein
MSDTDGDEIKLPEFPPGTLPPVGLPGNFLRRVKEDDNSRHGSRSSSLAARRRKNNKWDDGIGPGGPITQSAIFPQRRSQSGPLSPGLQRGSTDQSRPDDITPAPNDAGYPSPLEEKGAGRSSPEAYATPIDDRRQPVEIYDEGENIIIENRDGDVISVQPVEGGENVAERAKELASELKSEAGTSGWTYETLKKRIMNWREGEVAKRKGKEKTVKGEPARAFQFGSTVRPVKEIRFCLRMLLTC